MAGVSLALASPTGLDSHSLAHLPPKTTAPHSHGLASVLETQGCHNKEPQTRVSATHIYSHSEASKLKSRRQQAAVALRALREASVPGFSPRPVDSCLQVYMVPSLDTYLSPNSPFS